MLMEYAKGNHHSIELGSGRYHVPNYTTATMNGVELRIYGQADGSTEIKLWRENVAEKAPVVFNLNAPFFIQNVNFVKPDTFIKTAEPTSYRLFKASIQGSQTIEDAPVCALIGNKGGYSLGKVTFMGLGKVSELELLSPPAYGFIHEEDNEVHGINLMNFNANWSGGGVLWNTKNCRYSTGDQNQYALTKAEFSFNFTKNVEQFGMDKAISSLVVETDSDSVGWPTREAYTSRSAIMEVEGDGDDHFLFILPNKVQIQTYLQQINGFAADPNIKHETQFNKMLCGVIPEVGDTITLQREYVTNQDYHTMNSTELPDPTQLDYSCENNPPAFRSHICQTTVEQKHGSKLSQVLQEAGYYLQVGDKVQNEATGKIHTIVEIQRGYYVCSWGGNQSGYCMEYKPFATDAEAVAAGFKKSPDVFVYQNYIFDEPVDFPENPTAANSLVTFKVIKSRAAYLNDGEEYNGSFSWMSNAHWKQTLNKDVAEANNVVAHPFYNQRELNQCHDGSEFGYYDEDGVWHKQYYRENNMNYGQLGGKVFTITDPDTGEDMEVRSLSAYPYFGQQFINSKVPGGQFGGGYDHYMPQLDKLLRSQGITAEFMCMQRNIGEVNMGQRVSDSKYFTTTERRPLPKRLTEYIKENRRGN